MKLQPFKILICFVSITCWACANGESLAQLNTADTVCNANDTNILIKIVPKELVGDKVREMEYVVNISQFNCSPALLFSETVDKLVIKMQPFMGDYSAENLNDTSVIGEFETTSPIKYPNSSADTYTLIKKVLGKSCADFDLRKTKIIIFELALFEEETKQISDKYKRIYGLDNNFNNIIMADLIKQSELFKQLFSIFNSFSIRINKVSVEDMMLCVSSDNKSIMLDAIVYLETTH